MSTFLKKLSSLFGKRKDSTIDKVEKNEEEKLLDITIQNTSENTSEWEIKLNEKELIRRIENEALKPKKGYKKTALDIVDFYGTEISSPNKEYSAVYSEGFEENGRFKKGDIALIKEEAILYKKKVERPNDCHISNDGYVICCDWLNLESNQGGKLIIFDNTGVEAFSTRLRVNLGCCAISDDSTIAIFEAYYSDHKISVIDINQKKIIHTFQTPFAFTNADIDTENKTITLLSPNGEIKISYSGKKLH